MMDKPYNWTGVFMHDVKEIQSERKIALVECRDMTAAKSISGKMDCHFVYVMPPNIETIQNRLIRYRYGSETKDSLADKCNKMQREIKNIGEHGWIDKIIINDNLDRFKARAGVHIAFKLYNLR